MEVLVEMPLEVYMWRYEKSLKHCAMEADSVMLGSINVLSTIDVLNDPYLRGHMKEVVYNVKCGLTIKRIKEIEKENPECGKNMLKLLGYDNIVKFQKASDIAEEILKRKAGNGLIQCPSSKKCNEDPSVCYMKKYAQSNNAVNEFKERYDIEDIIIGGIKSIMLGAMTDCNPTLGSIAFRNQVDFK